MQKSYALTNKNFNKKNFNSLQWLRAKAVNVVTGRVAKNRHTFAPLKMRQYLPTKEELAESVQFAAVAACLSDKPKSLATGTQTKSSNRVRKSTVSRTPNVVINRRINYARNTNNKFLKSETASANYQLGVSTIYGLLRHSSAASRRTLPKRQAPLAMEPLNSNKGVVIKTSTAPNKNFFKFADGIYTSYWLGRLTNMFVIKGKKKKLAKSMQQALTMLKFKYQAMPLLILYELLEKLKPVFLLRKYKIRRTQLVEYPYVAKNSRRYMKALQ